MCSKKPKVFWAPAGPDLVTGLYRPDCPSFQPWKNLGLRVQIHFLKEQMVRCGDGSVGRDTLAVQVWGSEFRFPEPIQKPEGRPREFQKAYRPASLVCAGEQEAPSPVRCRLRTAPQCTVCKQAHESGVWAWGWGAGTVNARMGWISSILAWIIQTWIRIPFYFINIVHVIVKKYTVVTVPFLVQCCIFPINHDFFFMDMCIC